MRHKGRPRRKSAVPQGCPDKPAIGCNDHPYQTHSSMGTMSATKQLKGVPNTMKFSMSAGRKDGLLPVKVGSRGYSVQSEYAQCG